jgi:GntR family transcriptional repressor for pyruvate dehydrogenase complex
MASREVNLREAEKSTRIRAPKLPHIIAQRLRAQIASGELRPGDSLPSEAELLKDFGISRPTLREALRVLESETLIQLGRGSRRGAIILAPSIEMAAQYGGLYLATHDTTLGQIHEVRSLLEPPLAGQHARMSNKKAIKNLEKSVKEQRDALLRLDYIAAAAAVNHFHEQLVRNTGNTALRLLAGMLHEISANVYPQLPVATGRVTKKAIWSRSEQSTDAHESLVKLIKSKKPDAAEEFWREYMQDTADWLRKSGLSELRVQVSNKV